MLIEKAALLDLNVPEMTILVGGLRVLDANTDGAARCVRQPSTLSNDFFSIWLTCQRSGCDRLLMRTYVGGIAIPMK